MYKFILPSACLVGAVSALGCSAASGAETGSNEGSPSGSGGGAGGGQFTSGGSSGMFGNLPPPSGAGGTTVDPNAPCQTVSQQAEKREGGRADVIFVLDNSGSMTEEAIAVQNNMNYFSQFIAGRGIDVHVVVISSGPPGGMAAPCTNFLDPACWIGSWGDSNGVCIEPPLGLPGACPAGDDTNLAVGYMHWREEVGSHDALAKIQSTFSGWQSMLRPDSAKTFVVVTDDENNAPPTAAEFTGWVNSQPLFQGGLWRFSGVFCLVDGGNCAGVGATYNELVQQTGGIWGDMAAFSAGQVDAQFRVIFEQLGAAVVADAVPVACEWEIPPPPNGEELDPNAVNVNFTGSTGQTQVIYGVNSPSECTEQYGGWYYDDPSYPTRLIACPQSCAVMQSDENARVDVLFGCERELAPIM